MRTLKLGTSRHGVSLLKCTLGTLLPALFFIGCAPSLARYKEIGASGNIDSAANVRGVASVEIDAPIQEVWKALVLAKEWPKWNREIKRVSVDGPLDVGKKFVWGPSFPTINSEVVLCIPEKKLLWVGTMLNFKAIHSWKLSERNGLTIVSSEESLDGTMVTWIFGQNKLNDNLKNWLFALKRKAEMDRLNQVQPFRSEIER
jgi:hypothetical protein